MPTTTSPRSDVAPGRARHRAHTPTVWQTTRARVRLAYALLVAAVTS